jgi:hypothetical protein
MWPSIAPWSMRAPLHDLCPFFPAKRLGFEKQSPAVWPAARRHLGQRLSIAPLGLAGLFGRPNFQPCRVVRATPQASGSARQRESPDATAFQDTPRQSYAHKRHRRRPRHPKAFGQSARRERQFTCFWLPTKTAARKWVANWSDSVASARPAKTIWICCSGAVVRNILACQ